MSDITKCKGNDCPVKSECHRYTASESPYMQSFFVVSPFDQETKSCDHFWDNHDYKYEREKHVLKSIAELPPEQQDKLRKCLNEYHINIDIHTNTRYIRVFGENIVYESIINSQLLEG